MQEACGWSEEGHLRSQVQVKRLCLPIIQEEVKRYQTIQENSVKTVTESKQSLNSEVTQEEDSFRHDENSLCVWQQ